MRETSNYDLERKSESENKLLVDIIGMQVLLSSGKATARQIGKEAGAEIHVGRRLYYYVPKVKEYLEKLTEGQ